MRMGEPSKGNSIKVRRSAAEAGSRYTKIFVETANRLLAYEADRGVPVFSVTGDGIRGLCVGNGRDRF